jgi:hypothetical protein
MKKPIIKYSWMAKELPLDGEKNNLPSKTVPDQSMSIPELIRRYASGLPLGGAKVPLYEGEEDVLQGVNFQKLDLSEKHDFMRTIKHEYNETINRLRNNTPADENKSPNNKPTESNEG